MMRNRAAIANTLYKSDKTSVSQIYYFEIQNAVYAPYVNGTFLVDVETYDTDGRSVL